MKKRMIPLVALFTGLALVGIIVVQIMWIRHALMVTGEQFDRSVREAMNTVVDQLEKRENVNFLSRKLVTVGDSSRNPIPPPPPPPPTRTSPPPRIKSPSLYPLPAMPQTMWNFTSPWTNHLPLHGSTIIINDDTVSLDGAMNFPLNYSYSSRFDIDLDSISRQMEKLTSYFIVTCNDSAFQEFNEPGMEKYIEHSIVIHPKESAQKTRPPKVREQYRKKVQKVNEAIQQVVIDLETRYTPIDQRIDTSTLGKELRKAFTDRGIFLPYQFAITVGPGDSVTPVHSANFSEKNEKAPYRVSLFPGELIEKPDFLLVSFAGRNRHILSSLSILLTASAFFTLIMIVAFMSTIMILRKQKKLGDMRNDFINNMTHEFKTPLATIGLAVDSIENARVIGSPESVKTYTRVIREENTRMNSHVEQVLRMARMDRHELHLNLDQIDMHELIDRALENFSLQVEKRGGTMVRLTDAREFMVRGDELHLFNLISNLLDNAIKYSPGRPEIRVTTHNSEDRFVLSVSDKGMGMTKEAQKHIFEKFYRVPTGNIHNVKGFGLGLAYVKAITLAHQGEIKVKSELNSGSTFTLILPVISSSQSS